MEITQSNVGSLLEIKINGRLDNNSVSDLNDAIEEILRQGQHAAVLDLREIAFMSSAGLGALIRAHKRFREVKGFFGIKTAATCVEEVLRLTNLTKVLMCEPEELAKWSRGPQTTTLLPNISLDPATGLTLEVYDLNPDAKMQGQVWGHAERLTNSNAPKQPCPQVAFGKQRVGFGLGALGTDALDSNGRIGEFLAVAGGVAVQPTPAGGKPDYQLASGNLVPQPYVFYGVSCDGDYARMVRFSPDPKVSKIPFSNLVEQCLKQANSPVAALTMVVEAKGLIGAKLRQSPLANANARPTFAHPEIRQWISFTPEQVFQHSLVLIVGVASQGIPTGEFGSLAPLMRPLSRESQIHGHFHAAVFSYRPLKKRSLDLQQTVATLFDNEDLQAVLHLLNDDRPISGSGESEMISGACWIGSLSRVVATEGS